MTVILTVVLACYILLRFGTLNRIRRHVALWLPAIIVVPLISTLYSPGEVYREIGLCVHYGLIYYASLIFFMTRRDQWSLFIVSLLIAFAGVIWSVISSADFELLAQATEKRSYEHGRALGLYLQPNVASHVVTIIMLMTVMASVRSGKEAIALWAVVVYVPTILLTGSRAGVLLAAIITAYMFFAPLLWVVHSWRKSFANLLIARGALIFIVAATLVVLFVLSERLQLTEKGGVIDRIRQVSGLGVTDAEVEDTLARSDRVRLLAAREHIDNTKGLRGLFGHGVGASHTLRDSGVLSHASHNQFVEWYFSYGLLGLLALLGVLFYSARRFMKTEVVWMSRYHYAFFPAMMLIAVTSNTIFDYRPLYVMLGYLACIVIEDRKRHGCYGSGERLPDVA